MGCFKDYRKNWELSLTTGIAVLILLIIVGICIAIALPRFAKLQKLTDNLNRIARENLSGISVTRAYNAERYQEDKFEEANSELTSVNLVANRVMATLLPSISFIMSGLTLAIYWVGAVLIQNADITSRMGLFSDVVVFSSYAMQVVMAFMMLVIVFILMPRASVAAKRINEVLDTEIKIKNGTTSQEIVSAVGEIEFKNVSFKYPDADDYVIKDISFKVNRGETVAFIGATGSERVH